VWLLRLSYHRLIGISPTTENHKHEETIINRPQSFVAPALPYRGYKKRKEVLNEGKGENPRTLPILYIV